MSKIKKSEIVGLEFESGHLDERTFHLVRLASHLAAGNGYCAKWSVEPLRKLGVSDAEVQEAIGLAVRAGASKIWQEAIDNFPDDVTPPRK
ncbi:MAG: carboxymuconolactone decarboxylase family protein [Planctomycetota bacterium]